MERELINLARSTKLLKYLSVSSGDFTAADKKLTKAGANFSTYFSVGDKVVIANTSNNNGTFTVVTVAANYITFSETITAEASVSPTLSGIYISDWLDTTRFSKLVGSVYGDQAAILYIDQSNDAGGTARDQLGTAQSYPSNTDYTTQLTVTASTGLAFSVEVIGLWARIRVQLNAATAFATHRSAMNGRIVT